MKNIYRWDNLTRPEIKALADRNAIVIVPLGSTEQHGPHLPVGADALIATAYAERTAEKLAKDYGKAAVVAPTIAVANSIHHMSFPGTITLQPQTYMQMLTEYVECVAAHGFRKIILINSHGGNALPTQTAIITINEKLGFPVYFMNQGMGKEAEFDKILETQRNGIHACEKETSMLLDLYPDMVDPIYKETKGGNISKDTPKGGEGKPYTFHRMEETTENGAIGNSYAATPEKGRLVNEVNVARFAGVIDQIWQE